MKASVALCWHHMWNFDPPPHVHISACIYVVLLPYIDDILVFFMGLFSQRMSNLYVPHGIELQLVLHDTCFRYSIAPTVFISVEFLTPEGLDYAHIMLALEEKFLMY